MSCPYTSPQNGKAECMLRTTNNIVRILLFQASMSPQYWVESLHNTTYLLNCLATKTITTSCPYTALYNTPATYEHLRVFGCACLPNLFATVSHKLAPHSTRCAFIGYFPDHKGYRCLDISTNRVVITRHVIFDEASFPFAASPHLTNDYEFLSKMDLVPAPIATRLSAGIPMTTASGLIAPVAEAFSPTAQAIQPPAPPTAPPGGRTVPLCGLTALVVEAGGQTAPLGSPTTRVAEADGPTTPSGGWIARLMAPTTSPRHARP
jgi:hypothetical protein